MLRHETLTGLGVLTGAEGQTLQVLYVIEFWVVVVHTGLQRLPPGFRSQVLARGSLMVLDEQVALAPGSTWQLTLAGGTTHAVTTNPAPPLGEPNYALLLIDPDSLLDSLPAPDAGA